MNKRPDNDEVVDLLNTEQFGGADDADITAGSDPIQPTPIKLNLDQLQEYDNNPRLAENDKRDDIKEGFRERGGQTDTLNVTRRPGRIHTPRK